MDLINASTNECSKAPISKNWTRPGFQEIPIASQYPLQIRSDQTNTGTTIPKGKSDKQQPSPFCTLGCQHNHQLGSLLGLCGRICWLKRSSSLSSHANSTEVHSCTAALIGLGTLTSLDPTSRFHRESFGKCPKQRHGKCASFPVAYDLDCIPFMVGLLSLCAGDPTCFQSIHPNHLDGFASRSSARGKSDSQPQNMQASKKRKSYCMMFCALIVHIRKSLKMHLLYTSHNQAAESGKLRSWIFDEGHGAICACIQLLNTGGMLNISASPINRLSRCCLILSTRLDCGKEN